MASDTAKLYRQLRGAVASAPLTEILSQLLLLAKDLKDRQLEDWTQLELHGYFAANPAMTSGTVVPEYRAVTGLWHNEFGQPLIIKDTELSRTLNGYRLRNGAAELEEISRASTIHTVLDQAFPPLIRQHLSVDVNQFRFYSREVAGVITAIRSQVIDWLDRIKTKALEEIANISAPAVGDIRPSSATVFYSWQSDLPNKTNRGFIEDCLERAIKELKAEAELSVDPCIDRDTKNVPGSPDIAATIFEKIESCGLFVCDVSLINKGTPGRPTPNPNVLIELGFAVRALGWSRVVCILNQTSGAVEDLPFDLRHRRVRCYRLDDNGEKGDARKLLTGVLKSDLEAAFSFVDFNESATDMIASAGQSKPVPRVEVLDATLECQPPIARSPESHVHLRPQYVEGKLIWTVAASLFVDARPGEPLTVPLHHCEGLLNDRYSGTQIPLANISFQSAPQSQVSVDDAVLLIRGPGKVLFQGACETPFRQSGYPHNVEIEVRLPLPELGKSMEVTLELYEAHHGGGWPLRWKHRPSGE